MMKAMWCDQKLKIMIIIIITCVVCVCLGVGVNQSFSQNYKNNYWNHYMPIYQFNNKCPKQKQHLFTQYIYSTFMPSSVLSRPHQNHIHFSSLNCFYPISSSCETHQKSYFRQLLNWNLWGKGADEEVSLRQEVDVQDDSSQRVLGVAVVKACWPWDGVIADELIVWIPGRDKRR